MTKNYATRVQMVDAQRNAWLMRRCPECSQALRGAAGGAWCAPCTTRYWKARPALTAYLEVG